MIPFLIPLLALGTARLAHGEEVTTSLTLLRGEKNLSYDDWQELHEQPELGLLLTLGQPSSALEAAVDVFLSRDETSYQEDGVDYSFSGSTLELCLGVRRTFGRGFFRPYTQGGVLIERASISATARQLGRANSVQDSDAEIGYWFGGGLVFRLGHHVEIGTDFRYSKATVQLFEVEGEAGGVHFGATIGFRFSAGG